MDFSEKNETRAFAASVYATEILNRAEWAKQARAELVNAAPTPDPAYIIRKAVEVVSHAMAIYRILDPEDRSRNKKVKERAKLLREYWPNVPDPPGELALLRNSIEHFEERLDDWFSSVGDEISGVIDLHVGDDVGGQGAKYLRRIQGGVFSVMGHSIDMRDICRWIVDVERTIKC